MASGRCRHHGKSLSLYTDRAALLRRLRRIEGQVRGLQEMVEGERYCVDILTQVAACRAALSRVALILFEGHLRGCLKEAFQEGKEEEALAEVRELLDLYLGRGAV